MAIFAEKLLRGEQPVINGDGKQTRDYVYVGDLVRANLAALTSEFSGAVNLGTGIETDVNTHLPPPAHAVRLERRRSSTGRRSRASSSAA